MIQTILDFTTKLPGPLATNYLSNFGFNIIKVEHPRFPDRFNNQSLFPYWYQNINKKKEIHITEDVQELINHSIGVIYEAKDPIEEYFPKDKPFIALKIMAKNPQHDLNFLAEEGFLKQHIQDREDKIISPPFLPIAGVSFAHQVAMHFLFEYSKKTFTQKILYFEDLLKDALFSLKQNDVKYALHSGLCPCYNIYRLKDGSYIALAAVEERFWINLNEDLQLNFEINDRFNPEVKKSLSSKFLSFTKNELESKLKSPCALSFIKA